MAAFDHRGISRVFIFYVLLAAWPRTKHCDCIGLTVTEYSL